MKKFLLMIIVIWPAAMLITGCKEIQPEEKAAVIRNVDYSMCGGCGGWFIQVDTVMYRADLAASYKENTPVWIRFENDKSNQLKIYGRWIVISSIRVRK